MKVFLVVLCLIPAISFSATHFENCKVVSLTKNPADQELESGISKYKLCSDASLKLSQQKGYVFGAPLLLTIVNRQIFSLNMHYTFTTDSDGVISGMGTEYWYPGDSDFEIKSTHLE